MHIQPSNPSRSLRQPQSPPPADGGHHHHGWGGVALHVGHDVAMLGMALPGGHQHHGAAAPPADICTSAPPPDPHAGHHGHHGHTMPADPHAGHGGHTPPAGPGSPLNVTNLTAGLSAIVALGSAYHGVQMLADGQRLEGANHLLMSAGCGVMAAQMLTNNPALGPLSTGLMAAHGLAEVGLGLHQVATAECAEHRRHGFTKAAHGGCLAAAQLFPAAALPLYLGMAAATAVDVALSV